MKLNTSQIVGRLRAVATSGFTRSPIGRATSRAPFRYSRKLPILLGLAILACGALAGCNTKVSESPDLMQNSALPQPQAVVVLGFNSTSADLRLDAGAGRRLQYKASGKPAPTSAQVLEEVQEAAADSLVSQFQKNGIPAMRLEAIPVSRLRLLIIRGEVLKIDEGSRAKRVALGFGAGESDVSAKIRLSFRQPSGDTVLLKTYQVDSNSGRRPGLALGAATAVAREALFRLAVGAAGSALTERRKTGVAKDAQELGAAAADDIISDFRKRGWK